MKKYRVLILTLIGGLFFFGGISKTNTTKEVFAFDSTTSSVISTSTQENTTSSISTTTPVENSSTTRTSITFEDLDNDGIPDIINDYYNEHIRDQYMFGIGLGAILGVLASIVVAIYNARKGNQTNKDLKVTTNAINKEVNDLVKTFETQLKEIESKLNDIEKEYTNTITINNKYVNDYKLLTSELIKSTQKSTKVLENYSLIETKLNAVIECLDLIAETPDCIREGITNKVKSITKGVK